MMYDMLMLSIFNDKKYIFFKYYIDYLKDYPKYI